MLDFFLVLGQIPGTNFQITFNEIIFSLLIMWVIYHVVRAILAHSKPKRQVIQLSSLHSFSYPITAKPATPTHRIIEVLLASIHLAREARLQRAAR